MFLVRPPGLARIVALAALFLCARPALGQTLNGGQQSFVWTANCATDQTLTNNTQLPIAGLWIAVDAIGTNSPPELRTITVHDTLGMLTWDVDDNEDHDNDDGSENDAIDSTPNGPAGSNGWHRVQARSDPDVLAAGQSFTLRLCDLNGNSVAGRTVFVIPIAPKAGATGGDNGFRTALPVGLDRQSSTGQVSLSSTGAPPDSNNFSFAMSNQDGLLTFTKVLVVPPSGVTVQNITTGGGATWLESERLIVWTTPIPAGGTEQINVTLDLLITATPVVFATNVKIKKF